MMFFMLSVSDDVSLVTGQNSEEQSKSCSSVRSVNPPTAVHNNNVPCFLFTVYIFKLIL